MVVLFGRPIKYHISSDNGASLLRQEVLFLGGKKMNASRQPTNNAYPLQKAFGKAGGCLEAPRLRVQVSCPISRE